MELFSLISDIVFVIVGILVTVGAVRRIISTKIESVQDYIICIFFVFNCLPVILDYFFGVPQFREIYWWSALNKPMEDDLTRVIYDMYMLLALVGFIFYQKIYKVYIQKKTLNRNIKSDTTILDSSLVSSLLILAPHLAVIFSGKIQYFLIYGDQDVRGDLAIGFGFLELPALLLMSVYIFGMRFFKCKRSCKEWIILFVYSFSIVWICGKRYIIAVMLLMYVFFYINSADYDLKKRNKLLKIMPILLVGMFLFSTIYLVFFKVGFRYGRTTASFDSIYETLRVDFGRDGIIKYTLNMLLEEQKSYLDYPGQTILSMFFIWIPRTLWKTKPLQHFVYLTANIKGLDITNAGAGITPSWYEMCIANFDLIGIILAAFSIPLFCYWADKTRKSQWRGVGLLLIMALLTQSIDVYIFFLMLVMLGKIYNLLIGNRKIKIVYNGKKLF